MNTNTINNNSILAASLNDWFEKNLHKKDKWNDNSVGVLLKTKLQQAGNWKNAPKGNPSKGRATALKNKQNKEYDL